MCIFQSFKMYVLLEINFEGEYNSVVDKVGQIAVSFLL